MSGRPRILILGAGPGQVPIIQKAKARQAHVITVDNVPGNIGHTLSDEWAECSTADREGILALARSLRVDGVATMASDVAVPTLGYVADQLGLPGCSAEVGRRMANKAEFRAFQRRTPGLSAPAFVVGTEFEPAYREALEVIEGPLVIKPADCSGSRGVTLLDRPNEDGCRNAFLAAAAFSPSGTVCIESFIEGEDVSGDAFLIDGRPWATITRKYSTKFVPTGHRVPTHLSHDDVERVLDEVGRTCAALGYRNGPLDFDVRVSSTAVTVIELSARLGGNGIPALIEYATGVDLISMTVDHALGRTPATAPTVGAIRPCGSYVFGSPSDGMLTSLVSPEQLKMRVPEVFEYRIHRAPGNPVRAFEHSGNSVGHVLFRCGAPETYESVVRRVMDALDLTVTPMAVPVGVAARR